MKAFTLPEHDKKDFQRTGHAVVWCPNNHAPRPPKREHIEALPPFPNCSTAYRAYIRVEEGERVLIDGVLCGVERVQLGVDRFEMQARFEAKAVTL